MNTTIDRSHDPELNSHVESANLPGTDFPIQNLPFGAFRSGGGVRPRVGVAIGDRVLDLGACAEAGLLDGLVAAQACASDRLNELMALPSLARRELRLHLVGLLEAGAPAETVEALQPALVGAGDAELLLPARIGDYTDFYASVFHATNVGSMFRPDNPLLPNFKHVPIGYHGRASSVVVSGTTVHRPHGQSKADDAPAPGFGPSRLLDYEMEVGAFIGPGNDLGQPISIDRAEEHLFGLCLVNDWSARDIQKWEYQPLGPFLGKSFATSLSPWVVTAEALAPFRCPVFERPEGDPRPLDYLHAERNEQSGGIDVVVEVWLQSEKMREQGQEPQRISRGRMRDLYWSVAQMIAHHASNGCNLQPGDLLASGTISGPERESRGCLLERTWRGSEPIELSNGEERRFLADGDEVILRGSCAAPGRKSIGFGECRGVVSPALE
jgi:fumarylacetoacetase